MGLGIAAIQNTLELYQQGLLSNTKSVIEMGSQELHLKEADFEELVKMAGLSNYEKKNFPNLNNWPQNPRCSSRHFYNLLGIEEYYSFDLNEDLGSISHDYNLPLEDETLWSKFDLVTDHGSCEHAFNIGEAYRTMHRLCKPGGHLIISQALWGGNGYYLFDESFFSGIAAANNYKIVFSSYTITTETKTTHGSPLAFHIPINKGLLKTIDLNRVGQIGIYAVLQKQNNTDFQYPYQGPYLAIKQEHFGFNRLFYQDPPSYAYIPMAGKAADFSGKFLLKLLLKRLISRFSLFSKLK